MQTPGKEFRRHQLQTPQLPDGFQKSVFKSWVRERRGRVGHRGSLEQASGSSRSVKYSVCVCVFPSVKQLRKICIRYCYLELQRGVEAEDRGRGLPAWVTNS